MLYHPRVKQALLCLLLAACAAPEAPLAVRVERNSGLMFSWAYSPELDAEAQKAASIAATVWGGPADAADGWTLVLTSQPFTCAGELAYGCTNYETRNVTVVPGLAWCVEGTALAHEIGHVLGLTHDDPRYSDRAFWGRMLEDLNASGCIQDPETFYAVNVWRR